MVIYSAGLRLGEVVNLKIRDVDSDRMELFVKGGKGKKDRYTILSEKALIHLRKHYREHGPRDWPFEGKDGGRYAKRGVQNIFSRACKKAGVKKPATVHTLGHSFATHFLEKGTNLKFIQELLGHEPIKTTEVYSHLTNSNRKKPRSPPR